MATWNIVTLATVAKGNKFLVRTLDIVLAIIGKLYRAIPVKSARGGRNEYELI